jgi:hypothetical protein
MFKDARSLSELYPRLVLHGMRNLSCTEVMRYLGQRVNADGSVPLGFDGEVLTDLRSANIGKIRGGLRGQGPQGRLGRVRRGPESVRLKHRLQQNWLKMYDKAPDVLRVETVINNVRDMRAYRTKEGAPAGSPRKWMRLRKGVADLQRRAQISHNACARYLEHLAAVDGDERSLGELAADVCRGTKWRGRRARGLNPLSEPDAELLRAVNRGEFALNGFRNRDLRALLFDAPAPPRDPAARKRQSAQVTRRIRLLRAHGLVHKISGTHRYQLSAKGRLLIAALLTARAADTKTLLAAA